jgi:aryl-alcohol dehydrogenase-like predicted oxidoreductase
MQYRKLGKSDLEVSAIGYGAMVLTGLYGAVENSQAEATIRHALDKGINFIDTSDAYGTDGDNEKLVGRAVGDRRKDVVIATKFGIVSDPNIPGTPISTNWSVNMRINGTPQYVRQSVDASLKRLGTDYIDLLYAHFPDPATPIEETVGAMAQAVAVGKVRYLGLSNVNTELVRRAQSVHPIAAVQNEYSLWTRNPETELLPTLREYGISLVPWSPLGSGFLTGQVEKVAEGDFRNNNPRFNAENLNTNRERFAPLEEMANELGVTTAQLALAWILHQSDNIVPIPGTRKPERIDENAAAADIRLTAEQLRRIDELAPAQFAAGKALVE